MGTMIVADANGLLEEVEVVVWDNLLVEWGSVRQIAAVGRVREEATVAKARTLPEPEASSQKRCRLSHLPSRWLTTRKYTRAGRRCSL